MSAKPTLARRQISYYVVWLLLCMAAPVSAQNLVPNPGFEELGTCPFFFGSGGNLIAPPWVNGFGTTADIFNTCATNPIVGVPDNALGWQQPNTGNGYAGAILKDASIIWREYPQAPLVTPMIADQLYYMGMHVNKANYVCGIKNIGLLVSQNAPAWTLPDGIVANPQVFWENGYLLDTLNWIVIEGYYVAQGGENTVTLGNFKTDASTSFGPGCPALPSSMAYYYIDDVWIIPATPCEVLDVDLGDDVEVCFEYTIDPDLNGVHYVWSTGSTDPTLTVYESGVYGLTITDSCRVGSDHIQVTVLGNIPVDLGPDSVMICAGETYEIELDDEFGNFVWQDGSDDPEYSIEESGVYSVTYDDGCAVSQDTIVMDVLNPPEPFILGPDTIICEEEVYVISLDENLGEFEWSDGSDESSFTIEEAGTYSLTISNVCGEEEAEIEIVYDQIPDISFGPDEVSICSGDILAYEFDEEEGSYFWQDSSTSNLVEITTPGLYSVTVTNTCGSDEAQIVVSLTPPPQVDLGVDYVTCPAQLPDTLDVSALNATSVHWMDGSLLPQFIVTAAGMYSVTVNNVCGSGVDTIQVGVADILPDVVLPNDMVVCDGDSVWLYSTGDAGIYLWQDGTTNDSLLVQSAGEYILQVSTICGLGMDTTDVGFNPDTLYPNLGPDFGLCPGNSITLVTGNTFDNYLWQDLSTADSLVVSTPGTYIVTVSTACGTGIDTVVVSGNGTPPQLNLSESLSLCAGSQVTLDAGIGGVIYSWNDGTDLSTLTVNAPGTYSLTVSNNCGADMDSVVIVDGGSFPSIDLGNDIQLCAGESQIIAPDFSTADQWLWQDGTSGPTFLVNATGMITIEASNACGSVFDTLNAILLAGIPPLDLGNDTALCSVDMLILEINIPGVNVTWFDGSHNDQVTIHQSGTYSAEIENACGRSMDSIVVDALPDVPLLSLGPDQLLCLGEVIAFNPGIGDVDYLWQDGTSASSFSTTQSGLVVLTISNECGAAVDSVLITESTEGPQLDLGPDVKACNGDIVTIQAGVSGVTYSWQDGSTNSSFQTAADAQLILQISNSCGADIDTLEVQFIAPPEPDLGPDTTLCDNVALILNSNSDPQTMVLWQDGSQGPDFVVTTSGLYTLQQSNDCGAKTDSIVVSITSTPPAFSLGPDVSLCAGESVILHAPATADQLLWQNGSDSTSIVANADQVYSLTISNACGIARDEVIVDIDANIPGVQFDSVSICPGLVLTLDATQPFDADYTWSTGASESTIDVVLPGEYAVTIMTNCYTVSDIADVEIGFDCKPVTTFYIPNVFSPNGDGVNDVFTVQFNEDAEVIAVMGDIFDRWGNHVYYSEEQPFTWDGTFDGKTMNPAVFVYRFTFVYSNGISEVTEKITGDVTLIR